MSCIACETAQEPNNSSLTYLNGGTYVREGNGNLLIVGCQKHLEAFMKRPLTMVKIPKNKE